MNWIVIVAATTLTPVPPEACQSMALNFKAVVEAHTGAPASLRIKCEPYPAPQPYAPIPRSVLPPPPRPLVQPGPAPLAMPEDPCRTC
jgi:hypothetical protein